MFTNPNRSRRSAPSAVGDPLSGKITADGGVGGYAGACWLWVSGIPRQAQPVAPGAGVAPALRKCRQPGSAEQQIIRLEELRSSRARSTRDVLPSAVRRGSRSHWCQRQRQDRQPTDESQRRTRHR